MKDIFPAGAIRLAAPEARVADAAQVMPIGARADADAAAHGAGRVTPDGTQRDARTIFAPLITRCTVCGDVCSADDARG